MNKEIEKPIVVLPLSECSKFGRMDDKDIQAANSIANFCIGRHFSKLVGEYLIHRIQMSTEI